MLAHGRTVQALRARDAALELGLTLNFTVVDPVDPSDPRDVDAARRIDGQMNRIFLDPIFRGAYPLDLLEDVRGLGLEDHIMDGDLEVIATPDRRARGQLLHRSGRLPRAARRARARRAAHRPRDSLRPSPPPRTPTPHPRGLPTTAMGWEVQPEGLTRLLVRLHEEYTGGAGTVLHVTENGAAFEDEPDADGFVDDTQRTAYLQAHLHAVLDAIDAGTPVRGYFYWSFLDNFEWAWGYAKRFGIVRVDYETQERTPKASALELARVIRTRELALPDRPGEPTT